MAFLTASKTQDDLQQGGNSKYISKSGVYPVTILATFVSVGKGGSESLDFLVEYEGQEQVLYGNLRTTNNDGSANKIGRKVINQLLVVAGIDNVADPVETELPIGKKGALKTCAVLEDLCDIECLMKVRMEYSVYNGSITEKKIIDGFYRTDTASAAEIVNETEVGVQFEKDKQYFDKITCRDDLDEAKVAEWISAKRPKGTAGGASSTTTEETPRVSFGTKRFGK